MGFPGPMPKENRSRERDNPKYEEFVDDGEAFGPDLPTGVLPKGGDWHPMTLKWWESVRRYPLLRNEPDIGWSFLIDTALMHHEMWSNGRWEFAAELRQRAAKIATTPEDRLKMKVKIVPKHTPAGEDKKDSESKKDAASVTSLNARRDRLADK